MSQDIYGKVVNHPNMRVVDQNNRDQFIEIPVDPDDVHFITKTGKAFKWGETFLPFSQVATDPDGNIYVSQWLYDKLIEQDVI